MQEIKRLMDSMKKRAKELLNSGEVKRVVGWASGDFVYDVTPAVFESEDEIDKDFVFNSFCAPNLSKYLIEKSKGEGKTLVFLKPCDARSFVELLKEHRIKREKIYALAIPCHSMVDVEKLRVKGIKGITKIAADGDTLTLSTLYGEKTINKKDVLFEKCMVCRGKKHADYDELLCPDEEPEDAVEESGRFAMVDRLEKMTPEKRYEFWQGELSRCIRCNACRNVCPACSCIKCVFDNPESKIAGKANSDSFEEKMYHIIRSLHVAGRCTDCGECSRVCPQRIPLHLLNRRYIKDIDTYYGEYEAGSDPDGKNPVCDFTKGDAEPNIIYKRGERG